MKIALDTQLVMRTQARRLITGAAEVAGAAVIVPETAAFFAKLHYHKVARRYVAKRVEWNAAEQGLELDDETQATQAMQLLETVTAGFSRWLDEEPGRNDGMIELGRRTPEAEVTAMELSIANVVVDPTDHRWGVGEDPYVIAEALHAGAHWIASENLETIKRDPMERWLDTVQAEGRFRHVPRPFVLEGDGAVATLLAQRFGWGPEKPTNQVAALAAALCEPRSSTLGLRRRIGSLARFADDIRSAGLTATAGGISKWVTKATARLQSREWEVQEELEKLRQTIPVDMVFRTRGAEDRRLEAETGDTTPRKAQTMEPPVPGLSAPPARGGAPRQC